jgi:hypothetical protein
MGVMLALLLHGGWNTIVAADALWLPPFIVAFLITVWAIRRRKIEPPQGWFAKVYLVVGSYFLSVRC